jgi:co-chaperonin GroES (HSP10)
VTDSGFRLWKDASYNKEWNVTAVATIAALSPYPSRENAPISDSLDVNMDVVIDYKCIADFDFASDADHFHQVTADESLYLRKYTSKSGKWINVRAIPTPFGHKWMGWLQDSRMNHIDGVQGSESDLERWLSQFSFGKTDKYIFKNQMFLQGGTYWKVPYEQILAKKVNGAWEAVGNRLLLQPLEVDITEQAKISMGGIHLPESSLKARFYDRAILLSGGADKGLKFGDIVSFQEKYVEKYMLDGKEYFFIKDYRVDGKWN